MGKVILFAIIVFLIYYLFFRKTKSESKDLIMCDKCKTFYPEDEILKIGDKNICKDCYANTK